MYKTVVSGKVVIVDDEESIVWALKETLIEDGCEVFAYTNPLEIFDIIKKEGCDVLITDIRMPEIDGIELISKVKEINPDIAVIIITAYGSYDTAVNAIKQNVFDYISKPFDILEVKNIVKSALIKKLSKQKSYNETSIINISNNRLIKHPSVIIDNIGILDYRSTVKDQKYGNFYDVLKIKEDKYAVVLGNIFTNKSAASVLYIMIKDIIRQEFFLENIPSYTLNKIINILKQQEAEDIVFSILIGFLDIKENMFTYVSYNFNNILKIQNKEDSIEKNKLFFEWMNVSNNLEENYLKLNKNEMLFFITPNIFPELSICFWRNKLEKLITDNFSKENFSDELFDKILAFRDDRYLELDFTFIYFLFNGKNNLLLEEDGFFIYSCSEDSILLINQIIEKELIEYSFSDKYKILFSINEILINIILHAYNNIDDENKKKIYFKFMLKDNAVFIEIKDKGKGFDTSIIKKNIDLCKKDILNTKSRGLNLVYKLMDKVDIVSNENGTYIKMLKRIK